MSFQGIEKKILDTYKEMRDHLFRSVVNDAKRYSKKHPTVEYEFLAGNGDYTFTQKDKYDGIRLRSLETWDRALSRHGWNIIPYGRFLVVGGEVLNLKRFD